MFGVPVYVCTVALVLGWQQYILISYMLMALPLPMVSFLAFPSLAFPFFFPLFALLPNVNKTGALESSFDIAASAALVIIRRLSGNDSTRCETGFNHRSIPRISPLILSLACRSPTDGRERG